MEENKTPERKGVDASTWGEEQTPAWVRGGACVQGTAGRSLTAEASGFINESEGGKTGTRGHGCEGIFCALNSNSP